MSSLVVDRLGVQVPQIQHLPPDVHSLAAAEEAIELADSYGVAGGFPLDDSQRFTLRAALGERADGSWAAATVADFEPRQNGKNDTIAARELAGLVLFGENLLIHTAHEFDTANESFLRLVAVFEAWDDLRAKVAHIRYANGAQAIEMLSGQRLKYKARSGGSGRGFAKADLVVYDEAQHLRVEHVAASGPARLANPNNQSWYSGSGGLESSVNAWRLRRRALEGGDQGRFAYIEHTAEGVRLVDGRVVSSRPDVLDRDAWVLANAAYGRRITDESLMSLFGELGPELFGRECLCLWDPEPLSGPSVVDALMWRSSIDVDSTVVSSLSYGLSVASDGSWAAFASAGRRRDGLMHVDNVEYRPGTAWVVARAKELFAKHRLPIRVNPAGSEGALIRALTDARIEVVEVSSREYQQACGAFVLAVENGELRHIDQESLNRAVASGGRRDVGKEGGWAWEQVGPSDITPLRAATLALSGVELPSSRKAVDCIG